MGEAEAILAPLAITFGRRCGDPSPHAATLVEFLRRKDFRGYFAALAGAEIAVRIGDSMTACLHEALLRWANAVVTDFEVWALPQDFFACACRLFGSLADDECTDLLKSVVNRSQLPKQKIAAAEALESVSSRSSKKLACAVFGGGTVGIARFYVLEASVGVEGGVIPRTTLG